MSKYRTSMKHWYVYQPDLYLIPNVCMATNNLFTPPQCARGRMEQSYSRQVIMVYIVLYIYEQSRKQKNRHTFCPRKRKADGIILLTKKLFPILFDWWIVIQLLSILKKIFSLWKRFSSFRWSSFCCVPWLLAKKIRTLIVHNR